MIYFLFLFEGELLRSKRIPQPPPFIRTYAALIVTLRLVDHGVHCRWACRRRCRLATTTGMLHHHLVDPGAQPGHTRCNFSTNCPGPKSCKISIEIPDTQSVMEAAFRPVCMPHWLRPDSLTGLFGLDSAFVFRRHQQNRTLVRFAYVCAAVMLLGAYLTTSTNSYQCSNPIVSKRPATVTANCALLMSSAAALLNGEIDADQPSSPGPSRNYQMQEKTLRLPWVKLILGNPPPHVGSPPRPSRPGIKIVLAVLQRARCCC